ncbi:NAD-dependent epimerase/dehydratase family protein [Jannaschia aquimarina]|uniref:NAD dependent epimerase/dehydratase family protein n=1 Tax=Jannaschia aquimarina TaxID=935700 RepID=A0A0D1EF30_9RHOB|nr:hypothetical protein [Jannaschia aquimarina]KIT14525.1 NAD dependent epimerase/dehydratase family protein [Jannaschia aquimarina]SNT35703.1 Nucleoside-diphosphate-sugar epimerase [Jannaschia aquimarina]
MSRAILIGGAGQIGHGVATDLLAAGWDVAVIGRKVVPLPDGASFVTADRSDDAALSAAVGSGDLLLDCAAFDAAAGAQLAALAPRFGRVVAISSQSVYVDPRGRTLDEAPRTGFPNLPVPMHEDHPTVAPGPETYSTRKVAMERAALVAGNVHVLRPGAIHGPRSRHAREWWFVRRLRSGAERIPLAYGGRSRFQTTSVSAIAAAIRSILDGHSPRIANVCDADGPDVAQIGRTIMTYLGIEAELVGLPDAPFPPRLGATPWSTARPFVCASALPFDRTYAQTVGPALDWLMDLPLDGWEPYLPILAAYPRDHFDAALEAEALALAG